MISKISKSQKISQKRPLKSTNPNKSIKYVSNNFLSEFWILIKFNVDSKYDLEIFENPKHNSKRPL